MLQGAEEIAGQHVDLRDWARPAGVGLIEALRLDPVADPVGHVIDDSHVIDVADRRMVELGQRLGLAEKPGAQLIVAGEIDPDADPAVEQGVAADEEDPLRRRGHQPLEAVAVSEPALGGGEKGDGIERGHSEPAVTTAPPPCRLAE